MLNIEKYENELRKYGTAFALTKKGKPVKCDGFRCIDCAFGASCTIKRMNWLLEEYKEPILTEEEKDYLKAITKIYKGKSGYLERRPVYSKSYSCDCICIWIEYIKSKGYSSEVISFIATDELPFRGMEKDKKYTLEELDLC